MTSRNAMPPGIPPIVPPNPAGTSPRTPYELILNNSEAGTVTSLRIVRDKDGRPMFVEGSAPALVDTLNTDTTSENLNYATTPPEQGKTNVEIDFSRGLNPTPLGHYTKGFYNWGESVWTVDAGGLLVRAPELVTVAPAGGGEGVLGNRVEAVTTHNATTWFSAGSEVFYLDETAGDLVIKEPDAQPASSERITDIISWNGILIVAHDNADEYEWSDDDGDTWYVAGIPTPGTLTTSVVAGGSLTNGVDYYSQVAAVDQYGNEGVAAVPTPLFRTAAGANLTLRIAFAAVPNAVSYRIYVSNDTTPHFVGSITEAQRGTGIKIVSQDTTGAGGVAGAVDVEVAGTAAFTSPGVITTSVVPGGSLNPGTIYRTSVIAVDSTGNGSVPVAGANVTTNGAALTVRAAFAQVVAAVGYLIFMSSDSSPKYVAYVTEAQRASGIVITGQDTLEAGGTANAVDIAVAGTGPEPFNIGTPQPTDLQSYAKFFASYQESQVGNNPSRPILAMSADPNFVFSSEVPTDAGQWDSGSLVGQGAGVNPDHNTSLTVTPAGELLVGKELNLYQLDAAVDATVQAGASVSGNVALRLGPVPADTDNGMENFAWPVRLGSDIYAVINEYDICRIRTGEQPQAGFGPAVRLPAIPEAQAAIVAIASDNVNLLFAALAGSEGYVLCGTESDAGEWQWHGPVAVTGWAIRFMWVQSFPTSSSHKDNYLFIARNDSPYTIVAMRLPRTNISYDAGVTFVETATARLGPDYGGQAQVQKVLSRATPNTRNLSSGAGGPTCTIGYRTLEGAAFTALATFDNSPLPLAADLEDSYAPAGVHGTFVELEVTLDGDTAVAAALESVEIVLFRRPVRKALLQATVYADNEGSTREGGRRRQSWAQLRSELIACQDAIEPPILLDNETGVRWTVDIQSFTRRWMLDNDGTGAVMVCDLVMQELDTSLAPASSIAAGAVAPASVFHEHAYEEFSGAGTTFTLSGLPIAEPTVYVDRTYQYPGTDYTRVGKVITYGVAPGGTLRCYYGSPA